AAEARELIALAARRKLTLQVGHLERFNAAILAAEPYLISPRFIECHRMAPYRERGTDVNVVLDLMIHDIDIVQTIVGAPIESIDAIGTPV
ncbi:gfo/Idh/MocA family oxidoreductase, partial [Klebsiella pneumoniae]